MTCTTILWATAAAGVMAMPAASAQPQPKSHPSEVTVIAFAQGNCDPKVAKATAKDLRGAIARCVEAAKGKVDFTLASSKTGAASNVRGKGTLPDAVIRCIEARIEKAKWPRASMCDIELTVTAK